MNRRAFLSALVLLPALAPARVAASSGDSCPVCGGKLVLLGSLVTGVVADDLLSRVVVQHQWQEGRCDRCGGLYAVDGPHVQGGRDGSKVTSG